MAVKKHSDELNGEMEAIRAELALIGQNPDAGEDEIKRGDSLLEDLDEKEKSYKEALEREEKLDTILRASRKPGRIVERIGTGPGTGPQVMRRVDPYTEDTYEELKRSLYNGGAERASFDTESIISRAKAASDSTPKELFHTDIQRDQAAERLHHLLDLDNVHAPLIARHILLTGSEPYRQAFREYVQSVGQYSSDLLRTAMSLTAGNGGVLVPVFLDPTIILTNAGITGPIRSVSTVKTIATKEWDGVTSAGISASWTAEGVETADATPTYTAPTITPKKADAWVFGSYEVFQDSGFAAELGGLLADAKVRHEEAAFATANTGATRPRGVVAAVQAVTASIVTSATTNAFVIGDVYNTSDAVNSRQESRMAWLAHKKIFSKVRQFDTSGGGGFWANLGMGLPPQLLGAAAYSCSSMTSVVSTGANILLAGDFSQYYIVDRVGMSVIYDPVIRSTGNNRPTGQSGWYAFWRVGADVVNADAFRLLQLNQVAAATALG
jgi:HK97 family phage major capsid protein